jgi:hypothetical protein
MSEKDFFDLAVATIGMLAFGIIIVAGLIAYGVHDLCRAKHRAALEAIDVIDEITPAFGFGSETPAKWFSGKATPLEGAAVLRAPLSRRLCLAYYVELGFPVGPDFVSFDFRRKEHDSVPFRLDGKERVSLGLGVNFSPTSAHCMTFRLDDIPPQPETSGICEPRLRDIRQRSRKAWGQARLYEWIIPLDEHVEIVPVRSLPGHRTLPPTNDAYRPAEVEISFAWIHVGPRNDDAATLERLRSSRIAAGHEARKWGRRHWPVIPLMLLVQAYGGWIFWALLNIPAPAALR